MNTDMNPLRQKDTALSEQAARWLQVIEQGDAQQQAEFAAWLKVSPRHVEEVLCAAAVNKALDRLDAQHWPDVSKYLNNPLTTVVALREEQAQSLPLAPRNRSNRRRWIFGAAAAVACVLGAWSLHTLSGWQRYATAVGEQRALTLDDGSLAYLNTHSKLDVRFTVATREIELIDGEAQFKVQHDPTRPFLVRTDDAVIRAIGTQFNVYRRATGTVVSVVEGVVEISNGRHSSRFAAGEEARISGEEIERAPKADIARTEAWRQRQLIFDLDSLADVAEEFNRYNRETRIRVEGGPAQEKRFSGVFDADDPASLIKLLATYDDLTVEEKNNEIVIRSR